ncbi:MAG: hypothetical protein HQL46_04860 [Gammaproteobacteria bacterium]|nr:hypothetical protein [Gammaproteobacteria bacterium]
MIRILNVMIEGRVSSIEVPQETIDSASGLFNKMDEDMSKGWTMGNEFVDEPTVEQRCKIVAEKLLYAIEEENKQMTQMMCAYILSRVPNVMTVHIDNNNEINETVIEVGG